MARREAGLAGAVAVVYTLASFLNLPSGDGLIPEPARSWIMVGGLWPLSSMVQFALCFIFLATIRRHRPRLRLYCPDLSFGDCQLPSRLYRLSWSLILQIRLGI
jgi:hypothetical protein